MQASLNAPEGNPSPRTAARGKLLVDAREEARNQADAAFSAAFSGRNNAVLERQAQNIAAISTRDGSHDGDSKWVSDSRRWAERGEDGEASRMNRRDKRAQMRYSHAYQDNDREDCNRGRNQSIEEPASPSPIRIYSAREDLHAGLGEGNTSPPTTKVQRKPYPPPDRAAIQVLNCASVGDDKLLEVLWKAGVDMNARNTDGQTAMHRAAAAGHCSTVQTLLKAGAGLLLEDCAGRTARQWAIENGQGSGEMGRLLKTAEIRHMQREKQLRREKEKAEAEANQQRKDRDTKDKEKKSASKAAQLIKSVNFGEHMPNSQTE